MPFLTRGKARARQNKVIPPQPTPIPASEPIPPVAVETPIESPTEETKVTYQEVTYRVPKEERLLDLPLEEEVFGEQDTSIPDEKAYNITPVTNDIPIGVALKKKKRR